MPTESSDPNNVGAGVIQPVEALRALTIFRRETTVVS
jgi:hypothetical protein